MMQLDFLITPILSVLTGLITWFAARKRNEQEIRSLKVENDMKVANYYQGLLDDASKRLEQAVNEIMELEDRYRLLMDENRKVIEENRHLVTEIRKYKQLNGKQ